jgi:hypothetical protein
VFEMKPGKAVDASITIALAAFFIVAVWQDVAIAAACGVPSSYSRARPCTLMLRGGTDSDEFIELLPTPRGVTGSSSRDARAVQKEGRYAAGPDVIVSDQSGGNCDDVLELLPFPPQRWSRDEAEEQSPARSPAKNHKKRRVKSPAKRANQGVIVAERDGELEKRQHLPLDKWVDYPEDPGLTGEQDYQGRFPQTTQRRWHSPRDAGRTNTLVMHIRSAVPSPASKAVH